MDMSDQTARIKEMINTLSKPGKKADGLKRLIGMLQMMDRRTEQTILRDIERLDPSIARELRDNYFTFENVVDMDDALVKRALDDVHRSTLAAALRGASPAVRDKFLSNLSPRGAALVEDDMEAMGGQPPHIVDEAQREVETALKRWRNVIL